MRSGGYDELGRFHPIWRLGVAERMAADGTVLVVGGDFGMAGAADFTAVRVWGNWGGGWSKN